ncbi:hypothetical protein SEA_ESTES_76 [Mycobacterium phage Estes]|uniref:Uncharacterized protein n=1 Tax=Mycobacterium phage Estes TaxID=2759459 RepID=A0A7G9A2E6_9CAUD|nr:hypothetical protein J4U03_gp076 [Mycobacterium phage Estes]QNL30785.1 hypothetical protein SEA_ESTES_76 [Mycobacterium phage Estes]
MSDTLYTIDDAVRDVFVQDAGTTFAFNAAWLHEKAKLEDQYSDLSAVPEPLQSFIANIFKTGIEVRDKWQG